MRGSAISTRGALASGVALALFAGAPAGAADLQAHSGKALVEVDALSDGVVRVRVAPDGRLAEDASWAVSPAARAARVETRDASDAASFGLATRALTVKVDRRTLAVSVTDAAGHPLASNPGAAFFPAEGEPRLGPNFPATQGFELRFARNDGDRYFALGDKTGNFDRTGATYVDWNTDQGVQPTVDPLYKSIPFYVAAGGAEGAYGLFLDDTWRSSFDFAHARLDQIRVGAVGGAIDYYVIAGPQVRDVVRRYVDLTGHAPMLPRWAFGYQQSRYSYMSADAVRGLANHLRADRFPADVIWLDIDYQDRNRPFTTNPRTFPDMPRLVSDLKAQGIKLVVITDLHIADAPGQGYRPYDSGITQNAFVKNPTGSNFVGVVWPGPSVFPDFTDARVRDWWGGLYSDFTHDGIAGFWNDMNEPSVFNGPYKTMPLDTVHRIDTPGFATRTASHAEIHNIFGMEQTQGTFEGQQKLRPDGRPFVMTRATYAGGQKWSTTWTGDNASTWDQLRLAVAQTLNLGLSGFTYTAVDVGGFNGGPAPDLLTKWFEYAAFMPLFRDHATKGSPPQEPWVGGDGQEAIRRRYVETRYHLMPYLYAVAEESHRTGDPIARPVFYDYPEALNSRCDTSMDFTLGSKLLIAGAPNPGSPYPYQLCLPEGRWYDFWTDEVRKPTLVDEGIFGSYTAVTETPSLERLPVYVRAGSIIPMQPLVQSTDQTPQGPLELHVWPGPDCAGAIYMDDGTTRAFERGVYLRQAVTCEARAGGVSLTFAPRQGTWKPWWTEVKVVVHAVTGPVQVSGGGATSVAYDPTTHRATLLIPDPAQGATVNVGG